jgi:hypothetical protein
MSELDGTFQEAERGEPGPAEPDAWKPPEYDAWTPDEQAAFRVWHDSRVVVDIPPDDVPIAADAAAPPAPRGSLTPSDVDIE